MIALSILKIGCRSLIFGVATAMFLPASFAAEDVPVSPSAGEIDQHIERVVAGLLGPVVVSGEPAMKLTDRMRDLHIPGVSIAVIHDGNVQWARGFGLTAIGGPPVTPDTLFQAGSISKPVSAVAALALVQAGRLDLDADVNRYLRSWKVPANSLTDQAKVTIRELLSHSAGTTVHGFAGYRAGAPIPSLVDVLNGAPPSNSAPIVVDILPGTEFRYSGGGYTIMQQLLVDVTDEPFPSLVDRTVLRPFGMTHSHFHQPLPLEESIAAAMPYLSTGQPVPGGPHTYPELAAAGLWTTPTDLTRFALALQDALAGHATPVLSQTMVREMLTPGFGGYGLGLAIGGPPENRHFTHGGVDAGFESMMVAYETGDGAVVMTNGVGGTRLAMEVIRSIANEYRWPGWHAVEHKPAIVDPKLFDAYVGHYQLEPNRIFSVSRVEDRLFVQLTGQSNFQVFPESDRDYFYKVVAAQITFIADDQGHVTELILHQNGAERHAKRIE
jgi:CubicO group peptidase (beta-lactamase class C family)